ncbi:YitT family protein [Vaginisenegalia massiliensis]|uniref:YitT family protein n=1 Tax=Vaginisenegalia massiliensis TaxID=2058294 RepID=UPI000F51F65B|nr:YitT family protein [Vaginisenegalia massiliensis]
MIQSKTIISVILVLIGTLIFSIAVNTVIIPNHLGEGGVTGLTLLGLYLFRINPAISSFILNSILIVLGWKFLDKRTIYYTFISIASMSLFLQYIHIPEFVPQNSIIASIAAGLLIGVGIGIVVLGHGTTAGSDILAMMMKKYLGMNVAISLLLIDVMVVIPLSYVIGIEKGILTILNLFIASKAMNFVLEGFNPKKSITIISNKNEEIGNEIQRQIGRGITVMHGHGFYSKTEKNILYIVINRLQLMPLQRIIHDIDPDAFVTITDVQSVIGEGFTFYLNRETGEKILP